LLQVCSILVNGDYLFKRFVSLNGRFEGWQETAAIKRLLRRRGFTVSNRQVGRRAVIEGRMT